MIEFTLNGKPVSIEIEADTPLLWVLRENLKLPGTKFGCGMGLCGACTVHLASAPVRSCQVPVSAVAGQAVLTIEGLAHADASGEPALHPVQQAWIEGNVPQCGYCQSGQIMSAVALLAQTAKPTDADIDTAMSGNICRCGMYGRVRTAVHRAAELQSAAVAAAAGGAHTDSAHAGVELFDPRALLTRGVA